MFNTYNDFLNSLLAHKDKKTEEFSKKLIKEADNILGLKTKDIDTLTKELLKSNPEVFIQDFYKRADTNAYIYHEELLCIGAVICKTYSEKDEFINEFDKFAKFITNWASNDFFCCRIKPIKKFREEFFLHLDQYISSNNPWFNRIAIVCMLDWYLDDEYIDRVFEKLEAIHSEHYYVEMAKAWLYATAFVKCRTNACKYFKRTNAINKSTLSKTMQKIRDSRRVSNKDKALLKNFFNCD